MGSEPLAQPLSQWHSSLWGCDLGLEGDLPQLCCGLFFSWYMQLRLLRRHGRVPSGPGSSKGLLGWGCGLCMLEATPTIWSVLAECGAIRGTAVDLLSLLLAIPSFLVSLWIRRLMRARYDIAPSCCGACDGMCEDSLTVCCCYWCALAQQDRETTARCKAEAREDAEWAAAAAAGNGTSAGYSSGGSMSLPV